MESIGEGGYGSVWKAIGPGGFNVAIKILKKSARQNIEENAILLLRTIHHPNLIPIFGAWQSDSGVIIAMQLADTTLENEFRARLSRGESFKQAELHGYFIEIAKAIDYLNFPQLGKEQKIQHGDVKPDNIFLSGGSVQLGDFSLVKSYEHTDTTHPGSMTLAFVAPECINGRISDYSDQYSLAVTWYYLRTGRLPFVGSVAEILNGHLHQAPDLSRFNGTERTALERALAKEPARRWPNSMTFVRMLTSNDPAPDLALNDQGLALKLNDLGLELKLNDPAPELVSNDATQKLKKFAKFAPLVLILGVIAGVASVTFCAAFLYDEPTAAPVMDNNTVQQAESLLTELPPIPVESIQEKLDTLRKTQPPQAVPKSPKKTETSRVTPESQAVQETPEKTEAKPTKPPQTVTQTPELFDPGTKKSKTYNPLVNVVWPDGNTHILGAKLTKADKLKEEVMLDDGSYPPGEDRVVTYPVWNPDSLEVQGCKSMFNQSPEGTKDLLQTCFAFESTIISLAKMDGLDAREYERRYAIDPKYGLNYSLVNSDCLLYRLILETLTIANDESHVLSEHITLGLADYMLFWCDVFLADKGILYSLAACFDEESRKQSVYRNVDGKIDRTACMNFSRVYPIKTYIYCHCRKFDLASQVYKEAMKVYNNDSDLKNLLTRIMKESKAGDLGGQSENKQLGAQVSKDFVKEFARLQAEKFNKIRHYDKPSEWKNTALGCYFIPEKVTQARLGSYRLVYNPFELSPRYYVPARANDGLGIYLPKYDQWAKITKPQRERVISSLQYAHGRDWLKCGKMFHIAGCPEVWQYSRDLPVPDGRGLRINLYGRVKYNEEAMWYDWSNDADQILDNRPVEFCTNCMPFLALPEKSQCAARASEYFTAMLEELIASEGTANPWVRPLLSERNFFPEKVRMSGIFFYFYVFPDQKQHDSIRKMAERFCKDPPNEPDAVFAALAALSKVATQDDIQWMGEVTQKNVWWSNRIYAAWVLAQTGSNQAQECLATALKTEPFYFVRHQIEAAMYRIDQRK